MHVAQPFQATAQSSGGTLPVNVSPIRFPDTGTLMAVCAPGGVVYITKAQAMAFFNLVDPVTSWD